LGSGTDEGRNIASISWDNVCKSKEDGGLGVKKLELFNLALCAKWKWRCLVVLLGSFCYVSGMAGGLEVWILNHWQYAVAATQFGGSR
jgi:hypothetical protein